MERMGTEKRVSEHQTKDWLVIFTRTNSKKWWDRVFRTPFNMRHVMLVGYERYTRYYVLYDWRSGGFDTCLIPDQQFICLKEYLKVANASVIHFQTREDTERTFRFLSLHYCVTFAKQALRVPHTWILTPFQLYRYLLANGGTLVASYADNR